MPLKRFKLRLDSVKLYLTNQNQEKNQTLQYHVLKLTLDRVIKPQIGGVVIKRGGRNGGVGRYLSLSWDSREAKGES